MGRTMRKAMPLLGMIGLLIAAPLSAQSFVSDGYSFLKNVRDRDGEKVQKLLDKPSTTIILSRDAETGETALHIVAKRRDITWLQYILAKGADMNARDRDGNTALADSAQIGWPEGVHQLLEVGASVDLANNRGETPLILATNAHDLQTVRMLIAGGADPRITDHVAGMSAHDYAMRDGRSVAILKAMDEARPVKKKSVAGPTLN